LSVRGAAGQNYIIKIKAACSPEVPSLLRLHPQSYKAAQWTGSWVYLLKSSQARSSSPTTAVLVQVFKQSFSAF